MRESAKAKDEQRFKHLAIHTERMKFSLLSLQKMKEEGQNTSINQEIDELIIRNRLPIVRDLFITMQLLIILFYGNDNIF